ncbi:MAG TPA: hypothetical protein VH440_02105 [Candidatus Limnocylindrales bacterium]|jgi:hypothetical protein
MTDPLDDTQPHPVTPPAPQPNVLAGQAAAVPAASPGSPTTAASGSSAPGTPPASATATAPPASGGATDPPLQAVAQAAPSEWREPPWYPPRDRDRGPSLVAIAIGVVVLLIGLYYFLDTTLGIDLPAVRWGSLWPVILIVIGGVIVLRALGRRSS